MPRVDDVLDSLGDACYFTTLDVALDTGKVLWVLRTWKRQLSVHYKLILSFVSCLWDLSMPVLRSRK